MEILVKYTNAMETEKTDENHLMVFNRTSSILSSSFQLESQFSLHSFMVT